MTAVHLLINNIKGILVEGKMRRLSGTKKIILIIIGLILTAYQIWSVLFAKIDPINQMAIHLSLILMLTFILFTYSKKVSETKWLVRLDMFLVALAGSAGMYYFIHADRIALRTVGIDTLTVGDIIFGLIFVVLTIEAARRTIGFMIIAIALLFITYALYGHLLSGIWYHYEMSFVEVLDHLAFSYNGLWGSPVAVAASFVFIFILFGAFLQQSGAGDFFFQLSISIAGRTRGGAAKIAVITSAFFGMISGSPTANVVTTGPFTIPMAKKLGYSRQFAAAIEAVASTGGSLLPPIMGSSAFLMAAVTGIPYSTIAIAAVLPGILFYVSLLSIVHFEALRLNLPRTEVADIPKLSNVLKSGWHHIIPVAILIILLFQGLSPSRTGIYGIIAIIITSWFTKKCKMGLKNIITAMVNGAKSAIPVSTACGAAGLVIAGIMITGLGGKLTSIILSLTAGQLFPSLILIMLMCIVLGMGMPVAAAYVLTAMLAAPVLLNLGVSLLAAHLFIVYFSIISAITPPVAVAAFAAAGISGSNPTKVGIEAVRLGLASFIIPFVLIYNPAILMEGTISEIIYVFVSTLIGLIVLSTGIIGFLYRETSLFFRIILIISGCLITFPQMMMNSLGVGLVVYIFLHQYYHNQSFSEKRKGLKIS